jgi:TPR repeat protein
MAEDKNKSFSRTWWKVLLGMALIIPSSIELYSYFLSQNISDCTTPFQAKEYEKAYNSCSALADKGDVRAKLVVGNMYEYGYHVQKDYRAAEKLYTEVVNDQSNPKAHKHAHFALGELYSRKDFPKHNLETASKWFKLAADQGVNHAQLKYGIMLFLGDGIERNLELSKEYVMKASQNGLKNQAEQMLIIINSPEADKAAKEMLKLLNAQNG